MFAHILKLSLGNRLLVLVLAALLLVVGVHEARQLPVDVLPDLTRPTVSVQVEAPGLAAEDVEVQVAYPLETALAGLPGLEYTRSQSRYGLSQVTAVFADDTDIYFARQLINERLSSVEIPPVILFAQPQDQSVTAGQAVAFEKSSARSMRGLSTKSSVVRRIPCSLRGRRR